MSNSIIDSLDTLYKAGILDLEQILELLNKQTTSTQETNTTSTEDSSTENTVPPGYKKCRRCGEVLPLDNFYKQKRNNDGHSSWCKQCTSVYDKQRRQKDNTTSTGYKKCAKCGEVLPIDNFNKDKGAKDGHFAWCRECQRQYHIEMKQKKSEEVKSEDVKLVESAWKTVVQRIKDDRELSIAALLREVSRFDVKDNILYLIFNDNFSFARTKLNSEETIDYIESVIREVTNRSFNIQICLKSEVANLHNQNEINTKQRRFKWQL